METPKTSAIFRKFSTDGWDIPRFIPADMLLMNPDDFPKSACDKFLFCLKIEDLLEDEINSIDFAKISWKYAANVKRTNEIFDILESLPETAETKTGTIDTHLLLTELQNLNGEFFGIGFDIAVKRGFYLAFKLISYASSIG